MKKILLPVMVCISLSGLMSCSRTPKKTELTFMETMTSPERTAVFKQVISDFEKQNPDITVNLISPPYEQADNKLTLMLNNEQPLDIIEVRDYTEKQFVNNKKLLNLEEKIAGWDQKDDLIPATLECARSIDSIAYLIPQFFYVKGLFVRTDILTKLGITAYPKTVDELVDDCIKITDKKNNQYGYDFRGKSNEFKISDILMFSDVQNMDPANVYKTLDGTYSFTSPAVVNALKRYVRLFNEAVPSDGINWGFNEQINSFVSGITPFLVQDPDTVGLVDTQLGRDKYTVVPLPVGKSGKSMIEYGFSGLGIPAYSKNKDAAWKFISYILSAKVNSFVCQKYGPLPIHKSTFESDPFFSTGVYQAWSTMMNNPDTYVRIKYPIDSEKWPAWGQIHEQYMQSVLLGKMSPEAASEKYEDYWSK
jgi:multiple sugar transport system substrate-binding protein